MAEKSVFEMKRGVKIWLSCQEQYDLSSEGIVERTVYVNRESADLYKWWASMNSGEFTNFVVIALSAVSLGDVGKEFHM